MDRRHDRVPGSARPLQGATRGAAAAVAGRPAAALPAAAHLAARHAKVSAGGRGARRLRGRRRGIRLAQRLPAVGSPTAYPLEELGAGRQADREGVRGRVLRPVRAGARHVQRVRGAGVRGGGVGGGILRLLAGHAGVAARSDVRRHRGVLLHLGPRARHRGPNAGDPRRRAGVRRAPVPRPASAGDRAERRAERLHRGLAVVGRGARTVRRCACRIGHSHAGPGGHRDRRAAGDRAPACRVRAIPPSGSRDGCRRPEGVVKAPPGLVATALLFWGWQTGLLLIAVLIAVVLEGSRLVAWRWDLSVADEGRISDLSTIAFTVVSIYLAVRTGTPMLVFVWLPFALLLLMVAQAYSRTGTIRVSALLWARRAQRQGGWPRTSIDLSYIYVALCIAGASAANVRAPYFYLGMLVLSGWALWSVRSRAVPRLVWVGALGLAALLGYGGQLALFDLQKIVEDATARWLYGTPIETDPYLSVTAIGRLGTLKLSSRVVMRVDPDHGVTLPVLLREASYDSYRAAAWAAGRSAFVVVDRGPDPGSWLLLPGGHSGRQVSVSTSFSQGKGVLALPAGAFRADGLAAANVRRNRLGTVLVDGTPGFDQYRVSFHPAATIDAPPTSADLAVPEAEAPILAELAAELKLAGRPPAEVLEVVTTFFRERFRYSTVLNAGAPGVRPLADFLRRARSGHCEYFATATVLLLRTAGMPAR